MSSTSYASYRDVRKINSDLKLLRRIRRLMSTGYDVTPTTDKGGTSLIQDTTFFIPMPSGRKVEFKRWSSVPEVTVFIDALLRKPYQLEDFDRMLENAECRRSEIIALFMAYRLDRALLSVEAISQALEDDHGYCEISSDLKDALHTAYSVMQPMPYHQFEARRQSITCVAQIIAEMIPAMNKWRTAKAAYCVLTMINERGDVQDVVNDYVRLITEAHTQSSEEAIQTLTATLRVLTADHYVNIMKCRSKPDKTRGQKPNACVLNAIKSAINHFSDVTSE